MENIKVTPFVNDGEKMRDFFDLTKEEFLEKARYTKECMKEQINFKSIQYIWHEADLSVLEGLFARGDRRLSKVLLRAYEKGCLFDSWTEEYKPWVWDETLEECKVDVSFYTHRERSVDEILPWDFIDTCVSKKFLVNEWLKAKEELITPNCRQKCSACGAAVIKGGVCHESKN